MSILIPGQEPPRIPQPRVYARSGWQIPCETDINIDAQLMQIRTKELLYWRSSVEVRSASTFPYNCVGMIFAARRAWIEIDYIYDILREDGYHRINAGFMMEGDLALYKRDGNPTHVGLIITIDRSLRTPNIKVLSKWGKNPEFIHFIEDVPELLGQPAEYYTDRVPYETS